MLKQLACLQTALLIAVFALAQETNDYALVPGAAASVNTGGTLTLSVIRVDKNNAPHTGTIDNSDVWTINGHDMSHLTASDGNLKTDGMNFSKVTYTAPSTLPQKNPVIIQVRFPTKPGEKEMTILQCAVTITDAYKLTGDVTLSCALTNMDIQLHIEDFVRYTALANGAAMLEPVNGKSTLHVKVVKGIMVNKNGALGKYQSPMEFDMPVLISIDKQGGSSPATFYFTSFSPPGHTETYLVTAQGVSQPLTEDYINSVIGTAFVHDFAQAAADNAQNGFATLDWAHRMEAIQKKKPEELTAQDKADIAQMKALQQKVGTGNNPFSDVPMSDSTKVGDGGMQQNSTTQAPAIAVGNGVGELNVACTYNPSAKTVLEINKQGSDPGNVNHVTIHIKIEK